ncbi:hypothetical protein [Chryseobacterium sp. KCF3-3]|uniref:hypothetical protein n=1 Tax=Chryseobacterium sp. KCF3-3 TaxID=3231511 RepID=UPI0038B2D307
MTLAILIITHILYFAKVLDGWADNKTRGLLTGALLTLVCWQYSTTLGIVTLCYTIVILIGTAIIQSLNK